MTPLLTFSSVFPSLLREKEKGFPVHQMNKALHCFTTSNSLASYTSLTTHNCFHCTDPHSIPTTYHIGSLLSSFELSSLNLFLECSFPESAGSFSSFNLNLIVPRRVSPPCFDHSGISIFPLQVF